MKYINKFFDTLDLIGYCITGNIKEYYRKWKWSIKYSWFQYGMYLDHIHADDLKEDLKLKNIWKDRL